MFADDVKTLDFQPALCSPKLEAFKKANGGDFRNVAWSLKLDGVRTLNKQDSLEGTKYFSRAGKEFKNFGKFNAGIAALHMKFSMLFSINYVIFDGEVTDKTGNFQKLMENVHRKRDVDDTGFQYHIFDFDAPGKSFSLKQRQYMLMRAFSELGAGWLRGMSIYSVPHGVMDFEDEGHVQRLAQLFIGMGCEGIVLKTMHGVYEHKRHPSWCKLKARDSLEAVVLASIPGQGKHLGRMGALLCETMNRRSERIQFEVGTGFTDREREELNEVEQGKLVIEVAYGRFSNDDKSLIWPSFVRVRDDKTPTDVYENSDMLPDGLHTPGTTVKLHTGGVFEGTPAEAILPLTRIGGAMAVGTPSTKVNPFVAFTGAPVISPKVIPFSTTAAPSGPVRYSDKELLNAWGAGSAEEFGIKSVEVKTDAIPVESFGGHTMMRAGRTRCYMTMMDGTRREVDLTEA